MPVFSRKILIISQKIVVYETDIGLIFLFYWYFLA